MRYSQAEKMEIIRIVEESELSVKRTLAELNVKGEHLLPVVRPVPGKGLRRTCCAQATGEAVLEPDSGCREGEGRQCSP